MHWRRKWQPTPVFLPGESQGQWSLMGCHLWGRTESDTTEAVLWDWMICLGNKPRSFCCFWAWSTKWSRLRLTQFCQENTLVIANILFQKVETTLHIDIIRWSIPISQFIPPLTCFPLISIYLFSMFVSLFLLCKYLYHFSRFHTYVLIYDVYFCSVSAFYREKNVAQRDWMPFLWSHGWSESELRLELKFFLAWQLQICPWILMVTLMLLLLLSCFSRVQLCATP